MLLICPIPASGIVAGAGAGELVGQFVDPYGGQKMRVRPFSGAFAGGPVPESCGVPGARFTAVCDERCR